ncbi:MAG: hypothetical protein ABJN26_22595 [Stappiaceae bacterium]|uniref:hypothetical protein n=1 Tax=Roseibium sp. TaxID=1936156 RepID=UPI003297B9B1
MRWLIATVLIVLAPMAALAQGLSPDSRRILIDAKELSREVDIAALTTQAKIADQRMQLWSDALGMALSRNIKGPARRAALTRLIHAAMFAGGSKPEAGSVDILSEADIAAMRQRIFFPGEDDLVLYLLNRGPSLRDDFNFGEYTIIRLAPAGFDQRLIRERSRPAYLGIEERFSERWITSAEDNVAKQDVEQAKTRRLHLDALPELVLAAKALRVAGRVPANEAIYPMLIASTALDFALAADARDFRPVAFAATLAVTSMLNGYRGDDPIVQEMAQQAELRLPSKLFFLRAFSDAAQRYSTAPIPTDEPDRVAWAAWGEAMSLFAHGADSELAFDRFMQQVDTMDPQRAIIAALFLGHLDDRDQSRLGATDEWRAALTARLDRDPSLPHVVEETEVERDFLRIMNTIGRPDIAARFLLGRISAGQDAERERLYLRLLAPFVSDLFSTISFQMSKSGWVRRATQGYAVRLDFVAAHNGDGQLVQPGEVVVPPIGHIPYSATSPEEDLATSLAVFGPPSTAQQTAQAFLDWAEQAVERFEPHPSLAPMLKAIWIDWFSLAFEALHQPGWTLSDVRYRSLSIGTELSIAHARALLVHPAGTEDKRRVLKMMIEIRELMEKRYK